MKHEGSRESCHPLARPHHDIRVLALCHVVIVSRLLSDHENVKSKESAHRFGQIFISTGKIIENMNIRDVHWKWQYARIESNKRSYSVIEKSTVEGAQHRTRSEWRWEIEDKSKIRKPFSTHMVYDSPNPRETPRISISKTKRHNNSASHGFARNQTQPATAPVAGK